MGKEGGLFLSEQDVSLRGNQKAFPLCTENTWYGEEESKSEAGMAAGFDHDILHDGERVGLRWAERPSRGCAAGGSRGPRTSGARRWR